MMKDSKCCSSFSTALDGTSAHLYRENKKPIEVTQSLLLAYFIPGNSVDDVCPTLSRNFCVRSI